MSAKSPQVSWVRVFRRITLWVVFSCGALLMLAIVAVHLPGRAKLIGLFSLGLGWVAGFLIGRVARLCRVHHPRIVFPLAVLLTVAGLVGVTYESHRQWQRQRNEMFKNQAADLFGSQLLQDEAFGDLRRDSEQFDNYLKHRFSTLSASKWSALKTLAQWPRAILGVEILIGSLIGGWVAWRAVGQPYCETCDSWHEPQRLVSLDPIAGNRCLAILSETESGVLPNDARLVVECSSCRCGNAIPTFRCTLERPGQAPKSLVTTRPNAGDFSRLKAVLDGEPVVE